MSADIEHKIACLHEARVKTVHGRCVTLMAIINAQRPDDAARGPKAFEHGVRQAGCGRGGGAALSMAGSAKACSAAGGVVSSGRRPIPARASLLPIEGNAVITASGVAKAGPAARNSA